MLRNHTISYGYYSGDIYVFIDIRYIMDTVFYYPRFERKAYIYRLTFIWWVEMCLSEKKEMILDSSYNPQI